ncbi:MAG: GDSL-type esterase/lipase family protein [Ferruginibacter sp.]
MKRVFVILAISGICFYLGRNSAVYKHTLLKTEIHNYKSNVRYQYAVTYYPLYNKQNNIVMLGNSLVDYVEWGELLDRCDVANRGIGGDVTEGYLNRIQTVINCKPKVCFIEGGINDLQFHVPISSTIKNLTQIIDTLIKNRIRPIMFSVLHTTKVFDIDGSLNKSVTMLNKQIKSICLLKGIEIIDMNPYLSENNFLLPQYAQEDGLHLSPETYKIWKKEVLKRLD